MPSHRRRLEHKNRKLERRIYEQIERAQSKPRCEPRSQLEGAPLALTFGWEEALRRVPLTERGSVEV